MKLEVGKKYICRDYPRIKYVRIDAIRTDVGYPDDHRVAASIFEYDGKMQSASYREDGRYISWDTLDLVAEYQEVLFRNKEGR